MCYIDLHIHTNCSDGALEPAQIVDEAIKNDVKVISITDHDTIDAYTDELFAYAKKNGIELITGVEISTQLNKAGFHVLGYNIDITNDELRNKLVLLKNVRRDYLYNVSHKLETLGYIVNLDDLNKIDIVTKAHIAKDVINNKENENLLLKNFQQIPGMGEFIETVMNEGCPAYVKKETITPVEASNLIKKAGGKVILAHPVCYKYEDNINVHELMRLVKEMNADGIEAIYIYVDRNNHKINEIHKWKKLAIENHLLITIGSDFHQFDQIHPGIGLLNENIEINCEEINKIVYEIKEKTGAQ